jgi:hypothetical protein
VPPNHRGGQLQTRRSCWPRCLKAAADNAVCNYYKSRHSTTKIGRRWLRISSAAQSTEVSKSEDRGRSCRPPQLCRHRNCSMHRNRWKSANAGNYWSCLLGKMLQRRVKLCTRQKPKTKVVTSCETNHGEKKPIPLFGGSVELFEYEA